MMEKGEYLVRIKDRDIQREVEVGETDTISGIDFLL